MPTPSRPDPTPGCNGARNLFIDADPIDDDALTEAGAARRRRARGRVLAVDRVSPIRSARSRGTGAGRFTRPTVVGRVRVVALERIRRAPVIAGRLVGRVAARPYAALTALGALAGLLIALGWLGLAFTDASAAHRAAEQRLAAATAALEHDRARIDALSSQVRQAVLTARRQQTAETSARAGRLRAAIRQPARVGDGRR